MKLPPNVEFDENVRLFIWRPRGLVNESVVIKIVGVLGELEARSGKPFNRFTDTSGSDAVELNFKFVFHVSLFRRLSYYGPSVRSAILVTSRTHAHWSKMHALLTQRSPLKVCIFNELDVAAAWLCVPADLLRLKADS